MSVSTAILMIIFLFLIVPLILAEFARTSALPTLEDFFVQSRRMPTALAFFTVYSTWISVFAFLGASSYFYGKGPVYMTTIAWDALFGILFMVIGKRVWFYGKTYGFTSPAEFLGAVFESRALSGLVTLVLFCFTIPYLQIQLSGGAYLIEIASDGLIPWKVCGLIFYMIIIIYLWAGGLRAVALADLFYGILVFISMLAVGIFLIRKAGGAEETFRFLLETRPEILTLPGPGGDAGPLLWLSLFLTVPLGALMGPQLWLRYFAVEKKEAFNIMPFLICLVAVQCIGTVFSGLAGVVLVPDAPQIDKVLPLMLLRFCPPVLAAVFFCCIASAALSTANSQIHAVAALYTIDIHTKYFQPGISQKRAVSVGKWSVLFVSAAAYLMLINQPGLIIDTGTIALGGTAQIFPVTAGALFWRRSHPGAAFCGICAGVACLLAFAFCSSLSASYGALLGLFLNGLLFAGGSLLFSNAPSVSERIARYRAEYRDDSGL